MSGFSVFCNASVDVLEDLFVSDDKQGKNPNEDNCCNTHQ